MPGHPAYGRDQVSLVTAVKDRHAGGSGNSADENSMGPAQFVRGCGSIRRRNALSLCHRGNLCGGKADVAVALQLGEQIECPQ